MTKSQIIPNGTRATVTDAMCVALVAELREHLATSPYVEKINFGPKIFRETTRQNGRAVLIITAFAIVQRRQPEGPGRRGAPRITV